MPRTMRSSNRARAVESIKPTFHQQWYMQLLLAIWRWLPELILLAAFVTGWAVINLYLPAMPQSYWWLGACVIITPIALLMLIPPIRRFFVGWFWVDVTRHRLRSFMTENGNINRSYRRPWLLFIYPTAVGETAWMVTVAGVSADDIKERTRNLGSTCYATSGEIEPHKKYAYLFKVHIKRRSVIDNEPVTSPLVDPREVTEGQILPPELDDGPSSWAKSIGLDQRPEPAGTAFGTTTKHENKQRKETNKKTTNNNGSDNSNRVVAFVSGDGEDISDYL